LTVVVFDVLDGFGSVLPVAVAAACVESPAAGVAGSFAYAQSGKRGAERASRFPISFLIFNGLPHDGEKGEDRVARKLSARCLRGLAYLFCITFVAV
jgi:hypothetical protein